MEGDYAIAEGEKNSTIHAMSESSAGDTVILLELQKTARHPLKTVARAPISPVPVAVSVHCGLSLSRHPSSFLSSRLLPIISIPETSSSSDQIDTEADLSFSITTITVKGLHSNTVKADFRPVFQRFGEVTRIIIEPDGKRAAVIFADVHRVKNTLHTYAEKPLHVRGSEVNVFRKYTK